MIINDSVRLDNIKQAVSLIGTLSNATREYDVQSLRFWADQMLYAARELEMTDD